eukprot:1188539-Prorocentrum_minimum.AAC.2
MDDPTSVTGQRGARSTIGQGVVLVGALGRASARLPSARPAGVGRGGEGKASIASASSVYVSKRSSGVVRVSVRFGFFRSSCRRLLACAHLHFVRFRLFPELHFVSPEVQSVVIYGGLELRVGVKATGERFQVRSADLRLAEARKVRPAAAGKVCPAAAGKVCPPRRN